MLWGRARLLFPPWLILRLCSWGHGSPSVKWGEMISPAGTRLCEVPSKALRYSSSACPEGLVPVFPMAKGPGPADASGGVWEARGGQPVAGNTCQSLLRGAREDGRMAQLWAQVGRQPRCQARWRLMEEVAASALPYLRRGLGAKCPVRRRPGGWRLGRGTNGEQNTISRIKTHL